MKLCKFYNKQLAKTKQGQVNRAYTITHNHSIHSHKHKQTDTTHTHARARRRRRESNLKSGILRENSTIVCVCGCVRERACKEEGFVHFIFRLFSFRVTNTRTHTLPLPLPESVGTFHCTAGWQVALPALFSPSLPDSSVSSVQRSVYI